MQAQVLVPDVGTVQVRVVVETLARDRYADTDVVCEQTGVQPERATVMVQVVEAEVVQVCTPTHTGVPAPAERMSCPAVPAPV